MTEICPPNLCTGCMACSAKCPVSCISFTENIKGHQHPNIDQSLCINCGLCQRICPTLNNVEKFSTPNEAIASFAKDKYIRRHAQSGGISYLLSKEIVKNGGIFVGVEWDNKRQRTKHTICNTIEGLARYQGSRYIQSDPSQIYRTIKDTLNANIIVLFSGTACQIAGLNNFLGKEYENLFTIDILCHGVPSRKVFIDRIHEIESRHKSRVIDYRSRVKSPDQYHTSSYYQLENGEYELKNVYEDVFYRFFVANYGLRESCYTCPYAGTERIGDITLADFWGFTPYNLKFKNFRKGTSLIMINSKKGKQLFSMIEDKIIYTKRPIAEATSCNHNLNSPQIKPENYDIFWERYLGGEKLNDLAQIYFPQKHLNISKSILIKEWIKIILPYKIIKKLSK